MMYQGMLINVGHYLEEIDKDWANQLSIYGWLSGADIGQEIIVGLDPLCCKASGGKFPHVRIAEQRCRVSSKYQLELWSRVQHVWDVVNSDHIFRDLSLEESKKACAILDIKSKATAEALNDPIFRNICR